MFNKKVFVLALIIALIGINSTSAETGTITVTDSASRSYTFPTSSSGPHTVNMTYFSFDVANFNSITSLNITFTTGTSPHLNYPNQSNVTTFTCAAPNTCSGVASYSQFLDKLQWNFDSSTRITSSPMVLVYDQNIFSFITNGVDTDDVVTVSSTRPVCVLSNTMKCLRFTRNPPSDGIVNYGADMRSVASNSYNVTYPFSGKFQISVDKSGTSVSTKDIVHSQTNASGSFFTETSFNTINFTALLDQNDGIYLNVTLSSGVHNDVLINSSGIAAGPSPAPTAPYTSGNSINTTKTTYYNNESVNIFGSYYPATTTTTSCLFFGYICTDTVINTEDNAGYVFIWTPGSSSPVKFIKFTPDTFNNYNLLTNLDVGTYTAQLYGFAAPGVACQGGIVYDFGAQGVDLGCYYPHNTTSFQVLNATPGLYIHWNTKLANQTTLYGETVSVAWTNVTANDTVSIFDANNTLAQSYNINSSSVNFLNVYIPLYTTGTWRATIFNGSNQSDNTSSYLNVVPQGAVNFPNDFGITMFWQQGASTINTPVTLNWNTGDYTGFYNITVLKDGVEVRRTGYYVFNTGLNYQASYTFGSTGTYVAQFVDSPNETVQAQADILISTSIVSSPGTGNITPATGQQIQNTGTNLLNLFAVTAFYGLIIWLGIVGTIAGIMFKASGSINTGALMFIAVLAATFVALVGLFDPYKWYVLVLTWIFAGIYWRMNRDMVTEG